VFGPVGRPPPGRVFFPPLRLCRACSGPFGLRPCVACRDFNQGPGSVVRCVSAGGVGDGGRSGAGTLYVIPAAPLVTYLCVAYTRSKFCGVARVGFSGVLSNFRARV